MSATEHMVGTVCLRRSTEKAIFLSEADGDWEEFIPRSQVHSSRIQPADEGERTQFAELWVAQWWHEKTFPEQHGIRRCKECGQIVK